VAQVKKRKRVFGIFDYEVNKWFKTDGVRDRKTPRFETVGEALKYIQDNNYTRSAPRPFYVVKKQTKKDVVIEAAREYTDYMGDQPSGEHKQYLLWRSLRDALDNL
jgi:hypothetical protein